MRLISTPCAVQAALNADLISFIETISISETNSEVAPRVVGRLLQSPDAVRRFYIANDHTLLWTQGGPLASQYLDLIEAIIVFAGHGLVPDPDAASILGRGGAPPAESGLATLNRQGKKTEGFVIMSGFRMDDLNGDGRFDKADSKWLADFINKMSQRGDFGARIGGLGTYASNTAHGPFVHVDVRDTHARS